MRSKQVSNVHDVACNMQAGSSGSGLSAEQLRRIEENRHRAREKLASRQQPQQVVSCTVQHPATQPTSSSPREHSQHFHSLPTNRNHTAGARPCPTPSEFHPTRAVPTALSRPPSASHTQQSPAVATAQSRPPSHTRQAPGLGLASTANMKFTELVRRTIKANLILVSRQEFEVVVPYDRSAIEVFKKIPSNAYNAKTATWSFAVEAYNKLVSALQRDCPHIDLNQIPRSVVSLFQSLSPTHSSRSHSSSTSSGSSGWNGVGTKLASTLMQFQREGVDYCIGRGGRALLADDMGLGKTLQALAIMSHYRGNWPLLVICPSSVKFTWAEACHCWVPSLKEEDVSVVLTGKLPTTSSAVTIISYDLATRLGSELAQRRPDAIIVDESHFLKNFKTNRCKAILPLVKSATRCLLLSGTPALSRPIELYTQVSSLDKSFRMTRVNFGIRYCSGVKNHFGWDFSGASNLTELHIYMQEKFMIRRLKNDVLDELPPKRRQTVLLDSSMTKTHSREVRELRKELERAGTLKAMDKRSALLPLFEKTGRLKLPAVRDYILDLLEGGRKLIVFAHHRSVLDSVCECLHSKDYEYIRIDGRTPVESRQLLCDRFQHDETCLVAVLSITTANAGLTLTASSTVVFAELFWNPGILLQAEDRVYRIGQKNAVNIHYLVARETVDDFIWPLIQSKLTVLNQAGLAVDDFSNTDSTVLKGSDSQQKLFEFFGEVCSELDKEEADKPLQVDSGEGSDRVVSEGEPSKKRKRVVTEPLAEDDPDFSMQVLQKQKLSHKKTCSSISNSVSPGKQRTLMSMCGEMSSGGGVRVKGKMVESSACSELQSKAKGLASYLLSQQPCPVPAVEQTSVNAVTVTVDKSANNENTTGNSATDTVYATSDTRVCSSSAHHDAMEDEGAVTCSSSSEGLLPTACTGYTVAAEGGGGVSVCDGGWMEGLGDCDLTSFDNFEDDGS